MTLTMRSWGTGDDSRNVLLENRSDDKSNASSGVIATDIPATGKLRLVRKGDEVEAFSWKDHWQSFGKTKASSDPVQLMVKSYASSACPAFELALDEMSVLYASEQEWTAQPTSGPEVDSITLVAKKDGPIMVIDDSGVAQMGTEDVEFLNKSASKKGKVVRNKKAPKPVAKRNDKELPPPPPEEEKQPEERALLPHFLTLLDSGTNEITVKNEYPERVDIGIRSEGHGKDFSLEPNAVKTVTIPDGKYELYMIADNKPDTLFRGDAFSVGGKSSKLAVRLVNLPDTAQPPEIEQ